MIILFKFIIRFISDYNSILIINYLFNILRIYKEFSLNPLALLIKVFSFKFYKS